MRKNPIKTMKECDDMFTFFAQEEWGTIVNMDHTGGRPSCYFELDPTIVDCPRKLERLYQHGVTRDDVISTLKKPVLDEVNIK